MVEQIYDQLKTPKNLEELHQRLIESRITWNKAQLELFLDMDKHIIKIGLEYSYEGDNSNYIILDVIEKTIGEKPMIPIKKVMEHIPSNITISTEEIVKIAIQSGKYESPNGAALKKKRV